MNVDISYLTNIENELINKAHKNYGQIFDNSYNTISFIWNFIKKADPSAWIFISFLSQVLKSLTLALLSAIRKHAIQSYLMLRNALESGALACYGLTTFKPDEFVNIDSKGIAHEKKKLKQKAYSWLNKNYPDSAKNLKHEKDIINKVFAHSSIIQTSWNYELSNLEMSVSFLDKDDELLEKQRLWAIANTTLGLLDLFSKVISDYPKVELVDDFKKNMEELWKANEIIKKELMSHPRFRKWSK